MTNIGKLYPEPVCRSGEQNMEIDAWLLRQAIDRQQTSLRFYRWVEPTLSLGYFQFRQHAEPPEDLAHLPIVERLSGGGAILHDNELTYSFAVPAIHPLAKDPLALYRGMHRAIISALQEQGVQSAMRGEEIAEINGNYLCFLRGDQHDIICAGKKVLGSAQRRRKGAVLQHGSLILTASSSCPDIPGLRELSGVDLDLDSLIKSLQKQTGFLSPHWEPAPLPEEAISTPH